LRVYFVARGKIRIRYGACACASCGTCVCAPSVAHCHMNMPNMYVSAVGSTRCRLSVGVVHISSGGCTLPAEGVARRTDIPCILLYVMNTQGIYHTKHGCRANRPHSEPTLSCLHVHMLTNCIGTPISVSVARTLNCAYALFCSHSVTELSSGMSEDSLRRRYMKCSHRTWTSTHSPSSAVTSTRHERPNLAASRAARVQS
jgi:hypothetical protein